MAHSYYGGNFEHFYHEPQRAPSTAAYYERSTPYAYYDQPRQEHRSEYPGRPHTRAMIHEPETEGTNEQPRRRIAVACSRCRRRKIKCSGDPGDASGCTACRASGADVSACQFTRVGSHSLPGLELFLHNNTSTNTNVSGPPHFAGHINAPSHSGYGSGSYQLPSRPSLPTLHTRSTFPTDYDSHSQYEDSPIDAYTYSASAIPRQDSFSSSSAYGVENYRSWSTSGSVSAPVTATYYEPHQTYTFGNLQAPAFTTGRLPSVTADTFSPLNMGHLNSSLPAQTVHERRLPIPQAPYTLQYPTTTYAGVELPEIRPLGSYTEPRVHINGIHSRNAMPWTTDGGSRGGSVASLAPPNGMTHSAPQTTTAAVTESVLGYQFSVAAPSAASSSPNISPTGGTRLSDSYANTSTASILPPCSNLRYTASVGTQGYDARPNTSRGSMAAPSASLYSFSTETPGSQQQSTSNSDRTGADEVPFMSATSYQPPLRQPQPQHAASIEALRRQSSFDQQRASTAHRMSVSNLNGRY